MSSSRRLVLSRSATLIAAASTGLLLPEIVRMVKMAGRWRKDYFLSDGHDGAAESAGVSVRGQLA